MKTFYDWRHTSQTHSDEFSFKGRLIIKTKGLWLIKIPRESNTKYGLKGYIVVDASIYIYNAYIAKGLWDALKYLYSRWKDRQSFFKEQRACEKEHERRSKLKPRTKLLSRN